MARTITLKFRQVYSCEGSSANAFRNDSFNDGLFFKIVLWSNKHLGIRSSLARKAGHLYAPSNQLSKKTKRNPRKPSRRISIESPLNQEFLSKNFESEEM